MADVADTIKRVYKAVLSVYTPFLILCIYFLLAALIMAFPVMYFSTVSASTSLACRGVPFLGLPLRRVHLRAFAFRTKERYTLGL